MNNLIRLWPAWLVSLCLFAAPLQAQERGTANEAKALVERGVAHIKEVGKEKAFADFTVGGKWADRDLYIFVYDFNGTNLAFGNKPQLVGKDLSDLKDAAGKPIIKDLAELAKTKGSGWYDYLFTDPLSKKIAPKSSYVIRVPGADAFIGAGIYK